MADHNNNEPVRVTGEERIHPALQKLARALIALARLRQELELAERAPDQQSSPTADQIPPTASGNGSEVCHG